MNDFQKNIDAYNRQIADGEKKVQGSDIPRPLEYNKNGMLIPPVRYKPETVTFPGLQGSVKESQKSKDSLIVFSSPKTSKTAEKDFVRELLTIAAIFGIPTMIWGILYCKITAIVFGCIWGFFSFISFCRWALKAHREELKRKEGMSWWDRNCKW